MDIAGIILAVLYSLNFLCILFILFRERSDSSRRLSWLLAISFMPGVGVFFYIVFSGNFFTRTRRMVRATNFANAHYDGILTSQHKVLEELIDEGSSPGIAEYGPLIHLNLVYGKSPLLQPNAVWIFTSGEEKYRALFAELETARTSINLSYFIINNDHSGRRLMEILARKAGEGVQVRLLYDHVGSILTSSSLFAQLRRAGGMVNRFFPVSLLNPYSINYRNHRKIVVIDGITGYFGGMNIGDEYMNASASRHYFWRDTHVRIAGPAVQILQKQFLVDWYTAASKEEDLFDAGNNRLFFPGQLPGGETAESREWLIPEPVTNVPMQIVSSGPDDPRNDEIRDALVQMISRARESVYIETPYFTPDNAFFTALKIASLSGIDVRIIIPGTWDKWYVRLAAMTYVEELLGAGVRFWQYPGFIHAKMAVIDGRIASIGSTNVDTRSFSLNFELNAFCYSASLGKKCAEIFRVDQQTSRETTLAWFRTASPVRRAVWNFFRLFSPLF